MPTTVATTELHRRNPASGRWVSVLRERHWVRIGVGVTGNTIDPERRVPRSWHELAGGLHPELRSTWPVREVVTDRAVEFVDELRAELAAAGSDDPDRDLEVIDRWTAELLGSVDGPHPAHVTPPLDLAGRLLLRAYPLLRVPIEQGARPLRIPLVLDALLRHPDPRTAASRSLGSRVTRPLVRALATALQPDRNGVITWEPAVLASMAAGCCGPEQLVAVLTAGVDQPGAVSFSVDDVTRARAMFADRHPRRVAEELVAALTEPGGTARLATELATWDARPPAPPPVAAAPARPRPTAPARPAPDPCARPTPYPERFRAVDGLEVDGLRVRLLRTPNELLEWGELLGNCLGAYRTAVAAGRTHIIGFDAGGQLRAAAEISPARVLRQLEGPANSAPTARRSTAITAFLRAHRLVEVDARRS